MIVENYACAYREVIEILKYTNKDDVNKIPSDKILLWRDNMKEDYNFEIDEEKPLSEQNISKEARAILANIFKQYWATDYQKERIEAKEKYDVEQIEKEKYAKYNPNDIFKNRKQETSKDGNISNTVAMVEYKESIFKRIIDKIKRIFDRKNR